MSVNNCQFLSEISVRANKYKYKYIQYPFLRQKKLRRSRECL